MHWEGSCKCRRFSLSLGKQNGCGNENVREGASAVILFADFICGFCGGFPFSPAVAEVKG